MELDAEDPRSMIGAYHKCVAEPIAQFDWPRRHVHGRRRALPF